MLLPTTINVASPAAPLDPPAPPQAINLITAVLETLRGLRPLHQLRPYFTGRAFARLAAYVDQGYCRRVTVGSLRTQMPSTVAVEATLRLGRAARWFSCVLRLDVVRDAWRCTDLMLLRPPC